MKKPCLLVVGEHSLVCLTSYTPDIKLHNKRASVNMRFCSYIIRKKDSLAEANEQIAVYSLLLPFA